MRKASGLVVSLAVLAFTVAAAQAKIERPAIPGQCACKMTLRIRQFIRKHAGKAGLFRHRFEVDPQDLCHPPVAEDGLSFRIDDPDSLGHRLDNPAVHLIADGHVRLGNRSTILPVPPGIAPEVFILYMGSEL